jgi:hypothetical protein
LYLTEWFNGLLLLLLALPCRHPVVFALAIIC